MNCGCKFPFAIRKLLTCTARTKFCETNSLAFERRPMNLEQFNTLAEAEAFIRGLEYADNIWKQIEGPENDIDEDGNPCFNVYVEEL
jgi:hypothetical protein